MTRTEHLLRQSFVDPIGIEAAEQRVVESLAAPDATTVAVAGRRAGRSWGAVLGSAAAVAALAAAVTFASHLRSDDTTAAGGKPTATASSTPCTSPHSSARESVAASLGVTPGRLDSALAEAKRATRTGGGITSTAAVDAFARNLGVTQDVALGALRQLSATDRAPAGANASQTRAESPSAPRFAEIAAELGVSVDRLTAAVSDLKQSVGVNGPLDDTTAAASLAGALGVDQTAALKAVHELDPPPSGAKTPPTATC